MSSLGRRYRNAMSAPRLLFLNSDQIPDIAGCLLGADSRRRHLQEGEAVEPTRLNESTAGRSPAFNPNAMRTIIRILFPAPSGMKAAAASPLVPIGCVTHASVSSGIC